MNEANKLGKAKRKCKMIIRVIFVNYTLVHNIHYLVNICSR